MASSRQVETWLRSRPAGNHAEEAFSRRYWKNSNIGSIDAARYAENATAISTSRPCQDSTAQHDACTVLAGPSCGGAAHLAKWLSTTTASLPGTQAVDCGSTNVSLHHAVHISAPCSDRPSNTPKQTQVFTLNHTHAEFC